MSSTSSSVDKDAAAELRRRTIEKDKETRKLILNNKLSRSLTKIIIIMHSNVGDILKREEAECRKQIDQLKQEILQSRQTMVNLRTQIHHQNQLRDEKKRKIQTVIHQLDVMEEKAKVADIVLKNLSAKKRTLQTKILETTKRMLLLEAALRETEDRSNSTPPNETGERTKTEQIMRSLALEKTKRSENEVKKMQDELEILREEGKNLDEDYDVAKGSLDGANQVLQDFQSQLEELESDLQPLLESIVGDQLNKLVVSTEEKVKICFKLNSRLVEILTVLNKQPFN